MTGHPILRLFLLLTALGILGLTIGRLTASRPQVRPDRPLAQMTSDQTSVVVRIDSPVIPSLLRVSASGAVLADVIPKAASTDLTVALPGLRRGLDLVVEAEWPTSGSENLNALRIRIDRDDHLLVDTTLWGDPNVADVVTIPSEETAL
jgi:hypothetical protein